MPSSGYPVTLDAEEPVRRHLEECCKEAKPLTSPGRECNVMNTPYVQFSVNSVLKTRYTEICVKFLPVQV